MMMCKRLMVSADWGSLEVFDLDEIIEENDEERTYQKVLYLVDRNAPEGKTLLKRGRRWTFPKFLRPVSGPGSVP